MTVPNIWSKYTIGDGIGVTCAKSGIRVVELAFTAHQFLDAVFEDTTPHRSRPIVRVKALAVGSPSLALIDESDIDQFV